MQNKILPLLPIRDVVMLPGLIAPLFIGREKSIKALVAASEIDNGRYILLTTQKNHDLEDPKIEDLYKIGVLAEITQTIMLPNNNAKIVVKILEKVSLSKIEGHDFFVSEYEILQDKIISNQASLEKANLFLLRTFKTYIELNKKIFPEILEIVDDKKDQYNFANILISHIDIDIDKKQKLLEELDSIKRANALIKILESEIIKLDTEESLQQRVKKQIEKNQRDYYLHEKMKAVQKELDGTEEKSDILDLESKIKKLKLSKEAKQKAEDELKRLKSMNQMSAESSVVRNYLDILLGMPWGKYDKQNINIIKAEEILNRDHFGLEKIKERIVEYLAVLQRSKKIKGPILCLVGPPGVGKTSLAKSIAESIGRKYTKFSLGGVRDEAEIRGHRKTYLGAMPGKILTLIKKAKVSNPLILLDEIDKMGSDFRGDPASALLEVLDPEQNSHFSDHYLEVEYDLSDILFIATANSYDIPRALLDRMEIINISGYIEREKLEIAKNYLLPKQLKMHNISEGEIKISEDVILEVIRYYTRESGVRALERYLASLIRKALTKILSNKSTKKIEINTSDLEDYLGVRRYKFGLAEEKDQIGSTTGLAYSEVGGDLLSIEAVSFPGKGEIKATGKLGEVMKESVQAAYGCFRSKAETFGLKYEDYKDLDIHIHVPEGATPKDGPSAGIAIFTTIVSIMTKKAVKKDIAMTGEITLRGRVLPIGGLKEKLLAASRGGIKRVLIPDENVKDLKDIPQNIKDSLEIMPVSNIDQVLDLALVR